MKFLREWESNQAGNPTNQFMATLVTLPGETVLENSNGKKYKLATLEYETAEGKTVQRSAAIYEGNYAHPNAELKIGNSYLTTVTIVGKEAYLQMSHLQGAERASIDDFGTIVSEVSEAAKAVVNG